MEINRSSGTGNRQEAPERNDLWGCFGAVKGGFWGDSGGFKRESSSCSSHESSRCLLRSENESRQKKEEKGENKTLEGPEVHGMGRRTLSSVLSFVSLEVYYYSFPDPDGEGFRKPDRTGPDLSNCCVINMNEASL